MRRVSYFILFAIFDACGAPWHLWWWAQDTWEMAGRAVRGDA